MEIDVYFIEFYIFKKYNQKIYEYFDVNKSSITKWKNVVFPEKRLHEFVYREGTSDIIELIKKIY
jgi:hypothetical protein